MKFLPQIFLLLTTILLLITRHRAQSWVSPARTRLLTCLIWVNITVILLGVILHLTLHQVK